METRKNCFVDLSGREWEVVITVGIIRKVRQVLSIDLADAFDFDTAGKPKTDVLKNIAEDPVLLIDVLYCICEEQAKARSVSDVAFGELFSTGELIEAATNALLQGLLQFLPPAKRLAMEKILQIANRNMQRMQEETRKALENPQVQAEIDKAWSEQFMNMQGSSV